jgi:maltose O-acetyltransferase
MTRAEPLERLGQLLEAGVARHRLRGCERVGLAPRVSGRVWVHGEGRVIVGNRVFFDARGAPIELYPWRGASIVIGDDSYVGGGTSIEATSSIALGARARLGSFCKIIDNHFHPLVGDRHERPAPRPVVIEDDVTLGPGTIVLAGARVARGERFDAGSVLKTPRGAGPREPAEVPRRTAEQPLSGLFVARKALHAAGLLATDRRAGYERLARGVGLIRAAILFRGCEVGELVNALGHVRVVADGRIRLGDRVQLAGGMIATELLCRAGGELLVGARTIFNYGVSVAVTRSVRIGERCMLASMVRIRDESAAGVAPVTVGDDVWIAHGATVEPGVTIGHGSVVSAGAVVRDDVPPHSLAFGNPAASVPLQGVATPGGGRDRG